MAKATPTSKKAATKKVKVVLPFHAEAIQENPLSGKHYSEEEKQQMPTRIIFIDKNDIENEISSDELSAYKSETVLKHNGLKNKAIANNANRGDMLMFELNKVDEEHKKLTGKPFYKPQENDSDIWMWSILCDVLLITLFFAVRAISKQNRTIVEIADRHNNLFFENQILKEKLSSLTTKAE